tara:strand:- start:76802 stop:78460 length:1659 start_codon:yes stop_codon:yes gene_type:complete
MITSLLSLLSAAGPAGPAPALPPTPAFHAIAFVTDPLSHGMVGDSLLSLNECIQLHNGTLLVTQLSPAEQIQVSLLPGTGLNANVTWIEIDSEATPTITIQQDLESIIDTPFGLFIRGSGGAAVLDFSAPAVTRGMHSTSNNLILQGLVFQDAPYGLDVVQTDVTGQPGCTLSDCSFENLPQFGVRVTGSLAGGVGRLIMEDCLFDNVGDAVAVHETAADRTTIFESRDVQILGATNGFDFAVGTGGTARFTLDRVIVECTGVGIDLVAPNTNGRPLLLEGTHTRVRAATCARLDGANDAVTWMQCAMWNLLATPGGTALELGANGNQVYGAINEFRCVGDVTIATGGTVLPLNVRNMRSKDGTVTMSTSTTQTLAVTESRFSNCTTETTGTGSVSIADSCFIGGVLGGSSPAGSLLVSNSFIDNAGAGVTATQSLPQAQLGAMEVSPDDPALGSPITFVADLPAGLACVFVLGEVAPIVPLLPSPFFVYVEPLQFVSLAGVYTGQQSTSWSAPNLPQFRGYDLVVQQVVLPLASTQAPSLQLPPGWRFVLQ